MAYLSLGILLALSLNSFIQFVQSTELCYYYPYYNNNFGFYNKYTRSSVLCDEKCCSTSYPTSSVAACCSDSSFKFEWWWVAVPIAGFLVLCFLPFTIIAVCVVCCNKGKKGKVINQSPGILPAQTILPYGPNQNYYPPQNFSQQGGIYTNNVNYNPNNLEQPLPVIPNPTNVQNGISKPPSYTLYG